MSLSVIRDKGLLIGEHTTYVELPIRYVLHTHINGEFNIGIYYDRYLKGDLNQRCVNSDIPFASWKPGRGLTSINFHSVLLRDAGLWPELEAFCERAYEAWSQSQSKPKPLKKKKRKKKR